MEQLIGSLDKIVSGVTQYIIQPLSIIVIHVIVVLMSGGGATYREIANNLISINLLPSQEVQAVLEYYGIKPFLPSLLMLTFLILANLWQRITNFIGWTLPPYLVAADDLVIISTLSTSTVETICRSKPEYQNLGQIADAVRRWDRGRAKELQLSTHWRRRLSVMARAFGQAKFSMLLIAGTVVKSIYGDINVDWVAVTMTVIAIGLFCLYFIANYFYCVEQATYEVVHQFVDSLPERDATLMLSEPIQDEITANHKIPLHWWSFRFTRPSVSTSMTRYYSGLIDSKFAAAKDALRIRR